MSRLLIIACLLACSLAQDDESVALDVASGAKEPPKCYVCNSVEHGEECIAEKEGDKLDKKYETQCEEPFRVCRKITQTVRGDTTVIRSCGYELWKEEEENCYKTLHQEFNTLVCTCTGKGDNEYCNSASGLSLSVMAVVATVVVAIMAS